VECGDPDYNRDDPIHETQEVRRDEDDAIRPPAVCTLSSAISTYLARQR
jgi:hypothetical protein